MNSALRYKVRREFEMVSRSARHAVFLPQMKRGSGFAPQDVSPAMASVNADFMQGTKSRARLVNLGNACDRSG